MYQRPPEPPHEPQIQSQQKTIRVCLVFDAAKNGSHIVEKAVRNRVINPAVLPSGTWAVRFYNRMQIDVNGQTVTAPPRDESPLTLIAERMMTGDYFATQFQEVVTALKLNGQRPVIQLPAGAYSFNSDDLSGQYRVVHNGMRVVNTQGEALWPPVHHI